MPSPRLTETTVMITRATSSPNWYLQHNSHLWIATITGLGSSEKPVEGTLVVHICGPGWCNAELDVRRSCDAHLTREIFKSITFRSLANGNAVEMYLPFRAKKDGLCLTAVSLAKRVIWDLCRVLDNDMNVRVTQETKVLSEVGAWIPYGTHLRDTSRVYGLST